MTDLIYGDEVYSIIGAAIEVHRVLGPGFLEAVYQEALEIELRLRDIPFEVQKPLVITYKKFQLQKGYIADVVCYGKIIVELKALDQLSGKEEAQVLNYLKATGLRAGLLINFGRSDKLEWKKYIR
jgi:GxxExxY protein